MGIEDFDFSNLKDISKPEIREIKELFARKVWTAVLENDKMKRQSANFKRAILKIAKPLMETSFIMGYAYGKRITRIKSGK